MMDSFENRAYNKKCQAEQDACMEEVKKGIVLNGKETGQKGGKTYPTDGPERILEDPGVHCDKDEDPNDE
jgi:hypothetical protein